MPLIATEIFVPGSYPKHTYVERKGENLESNLRDAIDTPGQIISISGPSKSGKTVLVEKVVGTDLLIPITGAALRSSEDVWSAVLDWMDIPNTTSRHSGTSFTADVETFAKGSAGVPIVAHGEIGGTIKSGFEKEHAETSSRERKGLLRVIREIGNSDFVVLLDDFHYMERSIQTEVAKALKEAVRSGVKIITASVAHRGDDVVRANPELRGRVKAIDMQYWSKSELREIAATGFGALNLTFDLSAAGKLVDESAGSPQLMQQLCLQTCFVLDLREEQHIATFRKPVTVHENQLQKILEQTSASTDFRSLVDVLDGGPRTRGTERKTYKFNDGTEGDVYRVVLRAVADDPPKLSYSYEELLQRTAKICVGESPVGSSVTGTCSQMAKLALERFPNERAIDWDDSKQVLDIPDPYLLYYLRWSGRLKER